MSGAGIVRSLVFAPRDPDVYYYPDSSWATAFVGGSHEFLANGARLLDARAMMHYVGTGITPAMTHAAVGVGSQYAFTARDANGAWLDGGTQLHAHPARPDPRQDLLGHRHLRPPDPLPAANRQPLPEHPQPVRGHATPRTTATSSSTFGPTAPDGARGQLDPDRPGKGWFPILRIYGPLEAWFDKTWRPGEIEPAD